MNTEYRTVWELNDIALQARVNTEGLEEFAVVEHDRTHKPLDARAAQLLLGKAIFRDLYKHGII